MIRVVVVVLVDVWSDPIVHEETKTYSDIIGIEPQPKGKEDLDDPAYQKLNDQQLMDAIDQRSVHVVVVTFFWHFSFCENF